MTAPGFVDAPLEAYQNRPTIAEPKSGAPAPRPPRRATMLALRVYATVRSLTSGVTFYADWSYYQKVVNRFYPFVLACIRGDSGWMTDPNLKANLAVLLPWARIRLVWVYVVYIPGANQQVMARLKAAIGPVCPSKVAFRVDLETGSGFAGPGDHSDGANQLAQMLADYRATAVGRDQTRARKGVDRYGNLYDLRGSWAKVVGWLKNCIAAYSKTPPPAPWESWQYAGGDPRWPSPAGYPRFCAPFGSVIDMNVIPRPVDQILLDYGITAPAAPKPKRPIFRRPLLYTVRPGDTLQAIANRYTAGNLNRLYTLNAKRHPYLRQHELNLVIGWKIRVR